MTDPVEPVEQTPPTEVAPAPPTPLDLSGLNPDNPFPQPNPFAAQAPAEVPAEPARKAESDDELPAGWRKHIEDLRKENAKLRTESKADATEAAQAAAKQATDEMAQKFGKLFGLVDETAELTPEQLLAQAQAQREQDATEAAAKIAAAEQRAEQEAAKARAKDIALTVHHNAGEDVDAWALLDSTSFKDHLAAIDPASTDFDAQVQTQMRAFLDANPGRYRKATGLVNSVPRSGGSFDAGNAAPPATGEPSVDQLLKQVQDARGPGNRASRGFRNE